MSLALLTCALRFMASLERLLWHFFNTGSMTRAYLSCNHWFHVRGERKGQIKLTGHHYDSQTIFKTLTRQRLEKMPYSFKDI